ncbi:hypothetical protein [Lentilactobacillus farraginis]|uniref:Uncharacterized protein n=1 Tax=Lentilactobacillus farraginis DSM 18382 = JCM 14108 TaxID=1423743 RepID=X0PC00_9LACO|nr:hypothetical protein [Lentilactobacillus farraginis]KRM06899.1 hypothetical protein FD41_GL000496 [Lentilactobacillus farraginis DSM 18382 = JCM 14108]GAF37884.1 hypothetical protein JCM14108_2966 [Lentilactobacillus farraginis DSM 18382 = JCM 14108]
MAKEKSSRSKQKKTEPEVHYKTKANLDVHQMVINKSVLSIKVPTIVARKQAQGLLNKAIDDGVTPYYLKKETLDRLRGTHYE